MNQDGCRWSPDMACIKQRVNVHIANWRVLHITSCASHTQHRVQATHNIICNGYSAIGVGRTYQVQPPHRLSQKVGVCACHRCDSSRPGFIGDRAEVDVPPPASSAAAVAPASLRRRFAFAWHLSRRKATHRHTCDLQRGFWISLEIWG